MTKYKVDSLGFEVWVNKCEVVDPIDPNAHMYCVATFRYWNECLDFKDYCLNRKESCVIRTLMPDNQWKSEWRKA